MTSDLDRWADRRVLVTGSTGFKGAWLSHLLLHLGADVVGLALPEEDPSLFAMLGLRARMRQHDVDLRAPEGAARVIAEEAPDVVFHLAAQALVRAGYAEPVTTYATNAMGSLHLLEAVRAQPSVRAVVNVTTDKVYGPAVGVPHREGDSLGGGGPYAASKVCAELITDEARRRWAGARGLGLAAARAGNILGGGDFGRDRLVPDCVRAAQAGQPVVLRNPQAVRPWQHVLDALTGYLLLAERLLEQPGAFSGAWNFGPTAGAEPTVQQVARAVVEGLGAPDGLRIEADPLGPAETHLLRLDSARSRAHLGWRPQLESDAALHWTANWYARWRAGESSARLCSEQVQRYLEQFSCGAPSAPTAVERGTAGAAEIAVAVAPRRAVSCRRCGAALSSVHLQPEADAGPAGAAEAVDESGRAPGSLQIEVCWNCSVYALPRRAP